jgi:hypothetical protein
MAVSFEPLSNVMTAKRSQYWKQLFPMISTDAGMQLTFSKLHHLNAD